MKSSDRDRKDRPPARERGRLAIQPRTSQRLDNSHPQPQVATAGMSSRFSYGLRSGPAWWFAPGRFTFFKAFQAVTRLTFLLAFVARLSRHARN